MTTTRYFTEQILLKRPYLTEALCRSVIARPVRREVQADGRIRHWAIVTDERDGVQRALRVVTLDDGLTIHNAFYDRNFEDTQP